MPFNLQSSAFGSNSLTGTTIGAIFGALLGTLATTCALAATTIVDERNINVSGKAICAPGSPCPLDSLRFVEMKKRFDFPNEPAKYATWMTDTRFAYRVKDANHVESYGVVQFIRGCMFHSRLEQGRVVKSLTVARDHFGERKIFKHVGWEIDADSLDPLFSWDERAGRFSLLRWNLEPGSLNPDTATWHVLKPSPHGSVFVTDLRGAALTPGENGTDGSALNATLDFKTCLYKIQDLPVSTTPDGSGSNPPVTLDKALWCVDWDHKFVWDFRRNRMTRPKALDDICR